MMTRTKTIARNRTKAIDAIFANATGCRAYTLSNGFIGQECDARFAREALERSHSGKLQDEGEGRYCVHIHSNSWYQFRSIPE